MVTKTSKIIGHWQPPKKPDNTSLIGQYAQLERLSIDRHADGLWQAYNAEGADQGWIYMPYGPFDDKPRFQEWLCDLVLKDDPHFWIIRNIESNTITGMASFLRIEPNNGSIEVGHIHYSPLMQQTPAATETMYLMMRWAFENGYRRYEWKCNALNAGSRRAAQRLGFGFEGVFRQAAIVKGCNRDTAWFAVMDTEWSALRQVFEVWLDPKNFDVTGIQKSSLSDLTQPLLYRLDLGWEASE